MQGSLRNVVQLVPMLSEISEVNGYSDNHRLCPILFLVCDLGDLSSQTNNPVMALLFDSALGSPSLM